jgi:prevent-host-death family protein
MPGKPATMSQPRTIPPLATDAEAEAFLGRDLSGLDVSAFRPARFEFAGEDAAVNLGMPAGVTASPPPNSGAGEHAMPFMTGPDAGSGDVVMGEVREVSATEFKAKCLDLLDQVNSGAIARLEVTKRGKVVAVVTKPPAPAVGDLEGFLRGSVIVPPGLDLTAPTGGDEPTDAELGILHR